MTTIYIYEKNGKIFYSKFIDGVGGCGFVLPKRREDYAKGNIQGQELRKEPEI